MLPGSSSGDLVRQAGDIRAVLPWKNWDQPLDWLPELASLLPAPFEAAGGAQLSYSTLSKTSKSTHCPLLVAPSSEVMMKRHGVRGMQQCSS